MAKKKAKKKPGPTGEGPNEYVVAYVGAYDSAKHLLDYMRGTDDLSLEIDDEEREEMSEEELAEYVSEHGTPVVRAKTAAGAIYIVETGEGVPPLNMPLDEFEDYAGGDVDFNQYYDGHEGHMAINTRLFGVLAKQPA